MYEREGGTSPRMPWHRQRLAPDWESIRGLSIISTSKKQRKSFGINHRISANTESVLHYKESIEYLENESNCLYKIWTARSCQINGGSQTTSKRQRSIN